MHMNAHECTQMHTDARECTRMHTTARECMRVPHSHSHMHTRFGSQDECTRMHTNAYAYTTAFTVHYDALQMHSAAFTYIRRHPSASACTRASMQRPHKGVDAHRCAEVRGSVQDCTKNARGECTRMQMNACKKQQNARKRDAQNPPRICAKTPLLPGRVGGGSCDRMGGVLRHAFLCITAHLTRISAHCIMHIPCILSHPSPVEAHSCASCALSHRPF